MKINPEIISFATAHPILTTFMVGGAMVSSVLIAKEIAPVATHFIDTVIQHNGRFGVERNGVKFEFGAAQQSTQIPTRQMPAALPKKGQPSHT